MLQEFDRLCAAKFSAFKFWGQVVLEFGDYGGTHRFFQHHTTLGMFEFFGFADTSKRYDHAAVQGSVFIHFAGPFITKKRAGLIDDQSMPVHFVQFFIRFKGFVYFIDGSLGTFHYGIEVDAVFLGVFQDAVPFQLGAGHPCVTTVSASPMTLQGRYALIKNLLQVLPEYAKW